MKYWVIKMANILINDDVLLALLTIMMFISCVCIIALIVRNEMHERKTRRHSHIGHGQAH